MRKTELINHPISNNGMTYEYQKLEFSQLTVELSSLYTNKTKILASVVEFDFGAYTASLGYHAVITNHAVVTDNTAGVSSGNLNVYYEIHRVSVDGVSHGEPTAVMHGDFVL